MAGEVGSSGGTAAVGVAESAGVAGRFTPVRNPGGDGLLLMRVPVCLGDRFSEPAPRGRVWGPGGGDERAGQIGAARERALIELSAVS